jgi:hypothetical protein
MRRTLAVLTPLFLAVALLAGCGEDEPDPGTSAPDAIEITFSDGSVSPQGERVEVEAGEEIELVVKADEPGGLHIHTQPEQELEYGAGTTNLTLTIDEPGVVDVEAHELEIVVVQLEVR